MALHSTMRCLPNKHSKPPWREEKGREEEEHASSGEGGRERGAGFTRRSRLLPVGTSEYSRKGCYALERTRIIALA